MLQPIVGYIVLMDGELETADFDQMYKTVDAAKTSVEDLINNESTYEEGTEFTIHPVHAWVLKGTKGGVNWEHPKVDENKKHIRSTKGRRR